MSSELIGEKDIVNATHHSMRIGNVRPQTMHHLHCLCCECFVSVLVSQNAKKTTNKE